MSNNTGRLHSLHIQSCDRKLCSCHDRSGGCGHTRLGNLIILGEAFVREVVKQGVLPQITLIWPLLQIDVPWTSWSCNVAVVPNKLFHSQPIQLIEHLLSVLLVPTQTNMWGMKWKWEESGSMTETRYADKYMKREQSKEWPGLAKEACDIPLFQMFMRHFCLNLVSP